MSFNRTEGPEFSLFLACQEGDVEQFDSLIASGIDPNIMDPITFDRPIHVAVSNGSVDIVRKLLADERVDPNLAGAGWYKPIEIAKMFNYTSILKLLDDHGHSPIKPHDIDSRYQNTSIGNLKLG
jgi:ankyrin repeat protein